jgi:hypothetical protein
LLQLHRTTTSRKRERMPDQPAQYWLASDSEFGCLDEPVPYRLNVSQLARCSRTRTCNTSRLPTVLTTHLTAPHAAAAFEEAAALGIQMPIRPRSAPSAQNAFLSARCLEHILDKTLAETVKCMGELTYSQMSQVRTTVNELVKNNKREESQYLALLSLFNTHVSELRWLKIFVPEAFPIELEPLRAQYIQVWQRVRYMTESFLWLTLRFSPPAENDDPSKLIERILELAPPTTATVRRLKGLPFEEVIAQVTARVEPPCASGVQLSNFAVNLYWAGIHPEAGLVAICPCSHTIRRITSRRLSRSGCLRKSFRKRFRKSGTIFCRSCLRGIHTCHTRCHTHARPLSCRSRSEIRQGRAPSHRQSTNDRLTSGAAVAAADGGSLQWRATGRAPN